VATESVRPGARWSLATYWRAAASDLGLEVEAPFSIHLAGKTLDAVAWLGRFGAKRGMIIVSDFAVLEAHLAELDNSGFGFSTMSDPTGPYKREGCLEILRDWGWTGRPEETPPWL